ncbi:hypothetical protein HPB48_013885 [Haemaphysalis longicornis]|uniref:Uncharacterized protein n=1 Tax=Haemaphysalis longicornis TaxID=44386 RepID=A0A9J6G5R9_HAELO|nr:hypothetical protein HPB48_013885 [Haemaphysalis longicornis]
MQCPACSILVFFSSQFLFESMIKSCEEDPDFSPEDFLSNLIGLFGSSDVRSFIIAAEPACSRLLRGLAKELGASRRDFLMANFKHIFPYLLIHASSAEQLATALSFVEVVCSDCHYSLALQPQLFAAVALGF